LELSCFWILLLITVQCTLWIFSADLFALQNEKPLMHDWVVGASNTTVWLLALEWTKSAKVWIHICIGLILWTILNLLFIVQQDGRAWDEDHNSIVLSDQCIMICTAWYDRWAVDAVFCRWLALQGHLNVSNSPNYYLNGHYRIPF